MYDINVALRETLRVANEIIEAIQSNHDEAMAARSGFMDDDERIAIEVNSRGTLTNIWLKPGILDDTPPATIAADINRLLGTAPRATLSRSVAELESTIVGLTAGLPKLESFFPSPPLGHALEEYTRNLPPEGNSATESKP